MNISSRSYIVDFAHGLQILIVHNLFIAYINKIKIHPLHHHIFRLRDSTSKLLLKKQHFKTFLKTSSQLLLRNMFHILFRQF